VYLTIEHAGGRQAHTVPFDLKVTPGWRLLPAAIEFRDLSPGEGRMASLEVVDAFPGAGIVLDHTELSGPGLLGVAWRPELNASATRTFADADGYQFHVRGRLELRVEANSQLDVSHGSITLVPADSRRPRLEVPVTLQLRSRAVTAIPETLVLSPKSSESGVQKRLYLRRAEAERRSWRIDAPPGIAVQQVASPDPHIDVFEIAVVDSNVRTSPGLALRVLAAGSDEELLRIPVKFLGEARPGAGH
jgi:hypothetical protein